MARGSILAIDDEAMVTTALRRILTPRYSVATVTNARLAYDLLVGGSRYDVILSDVFMPMMSGMEFYELVRELDAQQAARIVFISGATTADEARGFFSRVPNRRLEKPVDIRALEALIDSLVPVVN